MASLPRGVQGTLNSCDATLGIGHRTGFLTPPRSGNLQVGIGGRIGLGESLLQYNKFRLCQTSANDSLIRKGLCWIGARDPDCLDLTGF